MQREDEGRTTLPQVSSVCPTIETHNQGFQFLVEDPRRRCLHSGTRLTQLDCQGILMPLQLAGHHRRSNNFGSLTAVPDGRTFSLEARAESWPRSQSQSTMASAPRLVEQRRRSPNIGPSLPRSTPPALRPDVTHFFPHAWLLAAQEATEQTSERDRRNSPLPMQLSLIFLFSRHPPRFLNFHLRETAAGFALLIASDIPTLHSHEP